MIAIDLMKVDRQVREAEGRRAKAERGLSRAPEGRDPFFRLRDVSSKSSFEELLDLPDDPLVEALRGWVGWLTIERVTWPDRIRSAEALHARTHRSRAFEGEWSPKELWRAMLGERESSSRRRAFASELERASDAGRAAARHGSERRREALRLLGRPIPGSGSIPRERIESVARQVLADLTSALGGASERPWEDAIVSALGRDATEGWPAALRPRWLADVFRGTELTAGLAIDVGELPEALGATSFARALGSYGRAVAEADLPRGMPFTIARAPGDPLLGARQALFAGLPAEAAFGRRVLGLGRSAARDQAHSVARALGLSLRFEALRALLSMALDEPPARASARAAEESAKALGAPLPEALFGTIPRLGPYDGEALLATLAGIRDRARLREEFDEDWFVNPRALEALRDEHHRPASTRVLDEEAVAASLDALRKELGASLA